jgi:hypothetical protein
MNEFDYPIRPVWSQSMPDYMVITNDHSAETSDKQFYAHLYENDIGRVVEDHDGLAVKILMFDNIPGLVGIRFRVSEII